MKDSPVLVARPSQKAYFFIWWTYIIILPWIAMAIRCASSRLEVYRDRVVLISGILSKSESEVPISDIRNVVVDQSFAGRMTGTGSVQIASAGTGIFEIEIAGVKNPKMIRDTIMEMRRCGAPPPPEAFSRESRG